MSWSLRYTPPKESELLDEYFLALGKSLYLANAFESKCRYVLRLAKIAQHFQGAEDISSTIVLIETLKDKLLGQTIKAFIYFPEFFGTDIELLVKAKDARNFIAHESFDIGYLFDSTDEIIIEQLVKLRHHVEVLATGDNIVSKWVYEIEEKEPAPRRIQQGYQQMCTKWVFEKIENKIGF